ncbi:hypothetical protein GWI33_010171 [Rhynchophorus ferrugineus]|uniref:Uncharacterized protein n=1 Tax=Rhynchophorus ferrugineus TaxID=354439 RepID=A0A834IB57_RHYFE|nr:hypothetical protein GWI33_010171 [Rhynchophorus ferrugineus]
MTTKELQTGFKGIRVLKNGSVLVECKTTEQKKAVKEEMEAVKTAEIKEGIRLNTRIKVIGIPSNIKAEIIEDIKNENEEVKTIMEQHPEVNHIKIIKKIPWNSRFQRQNWIFEVAPQIFNKIMKERTVIVDMLRSVLICMRCCRYRHSHKNCTSGPMVVKPSTEQSIDRYVVTNMKNSHRTPRSTRYEEKIIAVNRMGGFSDATNSASAEDSVVLSSDDMYP